MSYDLCWAEPEGSDRPRLTQGNGDHLRVPGGNRPEAGPGVQDCQEAEGAAGHQEMWAERGHPEGQREQSGSRREGLGGGAGREAALEEPRGLAATGSKSEEATDRTLTIFFHFILRFWYQVFTCNWLRPSDSARSILEKAGCTLSRVNSSPSQLPDELGLAP